jgi:hypothetical protein
MGVTVDSSVTRLRDCRGFRWYTQLRAVLTQGADQGRMIRIAVGRGQGGFRWYTQLRAVLTQGALAGVNTGSEEWYLQLRSQRPTNQEHRPLRNESGVQPVCGMCGESRVTVALSLSLLLYFQIG